MSGIAEVPGIQIPQTKSNRRGRGQGFSTDSRYRIAVEKYAVGKAIKYFEDLNWVVDPSPQATKPYDLLCTRGAEKICVEVKGSTQQGGEVTITRNEAEFAFANPKKSVLFLVAEIDVRPGEDQEPHISGGRALIAQPWDLKNDQLKVINYRCTLDDVSEV